PARGGRPRAAEDPRVARSPPAGGRARGDRLHEPQHRGRGDGDVPRPDAQAARRRGDPDRVRPARRWRSGVRRRADVGAGARGPPAALAHGSIARPRDATERDRSATPGAESVAGGRADSTGWRFDPYIWNSWRALRVCVDYVTKMTAGCQPPPAIPAGFFASSLLRACAR